MPVKFN